MCLGTRAAVRKSQGERGELVGCGMLVVFGIGVLGLFFLMLKSALGGFQLFYGACLAPTHPLPLLALDLTERRLAKKSCADIEHIDHFHLLL